MLLPQKRLAAENGNRRKYSPTVKSCLRNFVHLLLTAKFGNNIGEDSASLFLRDVATVLYHDETRIRNTVMQPLSVGNRDNGVLFTPYDERRLRDEMCVAADAFRVPIARSGEQAVMPVGGKERPSN